MSTFFPKEILENNISILKKRDFLSLQPVLQGSYQFACNLTPREDDGLINLTVENVGGQKIPIHLTNYRLGQGTATSLCEDLEDYDIVIFIGLGLGYNCIEILGSIIKKPRIVIVEPYIDIFQLAIQMVDLTEIFSYKRLDLLVGSKVSVDKIIETYKHFIPIGNIRIYSLPSYRVIFGRRFVAFEEKLKNSIRSIRDNWHTTKKSGRQIISNTIANFPSLFSGTAMNKLRDKFKSVPAVCIAAGPSLDRTLDSLKQIQNKALIIACDSSVNALLNADVTPNIVVTTDIFRTNFEKIKNHVDQLRDSILIYGIESNPDNVRKFLDSKRVAVSSSSSILLDWLDPRFDLNCRLPTLTSVSQMAIYFALALRADPIVLVGMDLSYNTGRSHSAGSVIQEDLNINKMAKITGVNGCQLFSSPKLIADKIFLEGVIAKSDSRFINTSMDGALIQGTEIKSLNEMLMTDLKGDADVNRWLSEIDWTSSINDTDAIAELNEMLQKIYKFKYLCECNEKLINELFNEDKNINTSELTEKRFNDIKRNFENFQYEYGLILGITELAIGEEIHEILKKRECLAAKDYQDQNKKVWDEIDLIGDHYRAFSKGADFFYNHLSQITTGLEKAQSLKKEANENIITDKWTKHLQLGRHYAEIKEIWQAEREYLNAIQIGIEDPSPWFELVQMYADSELWRPARHNVEEACRLFPDNLSLITLKADIEDKIRGIMSQIKDVWVGGNKENTRRLLNGYLLLCPDDEQANLLKDVLQELDETLAADSPVGEQQKSSELPFDELLANAVHCIERLEFEQAIGIIEGLIVNYPQKAAVLREKIGDIRMLQKDYPSAVWHYEQVLKVVPQASEIKAKIGKARQESEHSQRDCTYVDVNLKQAPHCRKL